MKKEFKSTFSALGEASYYVICNKCSRGVGVYKNGKVKRHLNGKAVCKQSNKFWKD